MWTIHSLDDWRSFYCVDGSTDSTGHRPETYCGSKSKWHTSRQTPLHSLTTLTVSPVSSTIEVSDDGRSCIRNDSVYEYGWNHVLWGSGVRVQVDGLTGEDHIVSPRSVFFLGVVSKFVSIQIRDLILLNWSVDFTVLLIMSLIVTLIYLFITVGDTDPCFPSPTSLNLYNRPLDLECGDSFPLCPTTTTIGRTTILTLPLIHYSDQGVFNFFDDWPKLVTMSFLDGDGFTSSWRSYWMCVSLSFFFSVTLCSCFSVGETTTEIRLFPDLNNGH